MANGGASVATNFTITRQLGTPKKHPTVNYAAGGNYIIDYSKNSMVKHVNQQQSAHKFLSFLFGK